MKRLTQLTLVTTLGIALVTTVTAVAQGQGKGAGRPNRFLPGGVAPAATTEAANPAKTPGPRHPGSPLVAALDANQDGVIDAAEIANAVAALKALDANGDGQLTIDEIRPAHAGPRPGAGPGGGRGPGHRRGAADCPLAPTEPASTPAE